MENKVSYYAVIPATVRYDKSLIPNAKLLYGEITALANANGYCWADNQYFMELYEAAERTIQSWLKNLSSSGYITIVQTDKGRKIYVNDIPKKDMDAEICGVQKSAGGIKNNTLNLEKEIYKEKETKKRYGELKNVLLKDKEYDKLCADYGKEKTDKAIEFLDKRLALKNYGYKSHYMALRVWVFDAVDGKSTYNKTSYGNKTTPHYTEKQETRRKYTDEELSGMFTNLDEVEI